MPIQEKCRVLDHQKIGPRHYRLSLASAYIASHAQPGQFVNVKVSEDNDPLLRRPISLHRIHKEHFELLYEVVGRGTEELSLIKIGQEIDVLGPLGSGFQIDPKKQIHVLVGGGMGIAPLMALAERLKGQGARDKRQAIYVLLGAKTKELVVGEDEMRKVTDQVLVSTDDGSYCKKGFISDLLLDFIDNQSSIVLHPSSIIYACGPRPMLKVIAELAWQKKIDCQVSMEERMACGIGACKGCPVKTKAGYKMVCKDGPVFDAQEIVFT